MLAGITDRGRDVVAAAMATYSEAVRQRFRAPLSRPQVSAMGKNCRRLSDAVKAGGTSGRIGRP